MLRGVLIGETFEIPGKVELNHWDCFLPKPTIHCALGTPSIAEVTDKTECWLIVKTSRA
jgi:hypothetical protein